MGSCGAVRRLVLCVVLSPVAVAASAFLDAAAYAQCVQSGTTVTCTGSLGTVSFTAPSVQTLDVGSLTSTATWISLTGTGSAPGSGGDSHYTCTPDPADCDITIGVNEPDTCTVKSGAPSGTECVATGPATTGPSGTAGPTVTITVDTGGFLINTGVSTSTIVGRSRGSDGGNGGNAYVVGNAGDGAAGANGGNVTVVLLGNATPKAGLSGAVAISLAGDGGNGGNAYVIGGSAGSGGLGGFGGDASVSHIAGTIVTTNAAGIGAFSQGGNGGSGGGGGGIVFTGGSGSSAGQAGAAQAFAGSGSSIETFGLFAYGILAQSLGGGGGSGSGGFGLFYSGGGSGSTGGAGGLVNVGAHGTVTTHGSYAHGILAQSIGGGGGDAGTTTGLVALGGSGAGGGAGGPVSVTNTGSVTTFGFGANAIEAQSIGGGGGNGSSTGGLVSLGGNGAGTTIGGTVTVSNSGALMTSGAIASGILAQSIGGGGGNGGTSGGLFSWGGNGGSGANGGTVTVFNGGNITTGLDGILSLASHGIVAQSIGGGGGNGGGSIAVDPGVTGISAAFGGTGGSGGNGGLAQLKLDNALSSAATAYAIETFGPQSNAVTVQSIGGGGGSGGFSVSGSLVVALGVSGAGGPGGAGGLVDVATKGTLTTHQDLSIGILAQSIGGGGGNGGFSLTAGAGAAVSIGGGGGLGGAASVVTVSSLSDISTAGAGSHGILAQSIGGGGGNGGLSGAASLAVSVGVGGSGGSGGTSAFVSVSSIGTVSTLGENAMGVVAQSLGGGGGNGGAALALGVGVGNVSVGIGGSGGSGGSSGDVSLFHDGLVTTSGANAPGVLGQSVGGGGGTGGFSFTLAGGAAVGVAVGVGGTGGGGSQAGAVTVVTTGAGVTTVGTQSPGIWAQSIGGGGGTGGFAVGIAAAATFMGVGGAAAVTVGGSGGLAGNASTVNVNATGTITTQGDFSHGIEAQSIGGGGGSGGFSVAGAFTLGQVAAGVAVGGGGNGGGSAEAVTVLTAGVAAPVGFWNSPAFGVTTISTQGTRASGILAQSIGGGGGNGGFAGSLGVALAGAGGGVSVGGGGAGGGISKLVDVTSYHNIVTTGERSVGILAQSIGGGGGNGGFSIGLGGGSVFGGGVSVGGGGDSGSDAGDVLVRSYGTISTSGTDAHGIQAQSLGGGGGNGGSSIGGAFTTGSVALGVAVGGTGSGGGSAGNEVKVLAYAAAQNGAAVVTPPPTSLVTLSTSGASANGIFAQSIGGGGGNGGFAGSGGVATGGFGVGFSVGGNGGGGGNGGTVIVASVHNIKTAGETANGILAQSIGGGGGNGGFALGIGGGSQFGGSVGIGGFGDGGGSAATVSASSTGTIWTIGNDANGLAAQSIGGGGGNGGFAIAGSFTTGPVGLGLSVGGAGAGGGTGSAVIVRGFAADANGFVVPPAGEITLQTEGDRANGILAQSIGGGGGNGGFSVAGGGATGNVGLGISVGGLGAGGGAAGSVQVTSVHNVLTDGLNSHGILAQSLGGGGGNGGFSLALGAGAKFGGAISIGGFATGGGGNAGTVTVDSSGTIQTKGLDSYGILAQSIGGSGGNGGASLAGSFSADTSGAAISIGGAGSNGGLGGAVTVTSNLGRAIGNHLTIQTESGPGIFAQSLGGGGGNGGLAGSLAIVASAKVALSVAVGGFGGAGNSADVVNVTSRDHILTKADSSSGILAQSIGGGGGLGGVALGGSLTIPAGKELSITAAFGGKGGDGANAGAVMVNFLGSISTAGDFSDGITAQSIGGGGGNGRLSVAATINACTACPNNIPTASTSVGGFGGAGGAGADVSVTFGGTVVTRGEEAVGVNAQSLGGGGGNGGIAIGGSISGGDSKQFSGALGGFGGPGSTAGNVVVTNAGSITTGSVETRQVQIAVLGLVFAPVVVREGRRSFGILAQSIGGGGGNGGLSIAGGIGRVGTSANVNMGLSIGGRGGSGGLAGTVNVTNNGQITTYGPEAHAIFAQSIGGGGGNGGGSISGLVSGGNPTSSTAHAFNVSVAIGGLGGDGNLGSTVTVTQSGGLVTSGAGSHGIFAQSIGGGGGTGGGANSISLMLGTECTREQGKLEKLFIAICDQTEDEKDADKKKKKGVKFQGAIGGFGGSGNDAGTVTVNNHGFITTTGEHSAGIKAQSIGGGGGSGGHGVSGTDGLFPGFVGTAVDKVLGLADTFLDTTGKLDFLTFTLGGKGGAAGDGGAVVVTNDGSITTQAFGAKAVFAQSIGGGGGDGGESSSGDDGLLSIGGFGGAAGNGGSVTLTNLAAGQITTFGNMAHAVFAQSVGGGGGAGGSASGVIAIGGVGGSPQPFFDFIDSIDFANLFPITSLPTTGHGGEVRIANHGSIVTHGLASYGIFGQSIGGGGGEQTGNGGSVSKSKIAIGGFGATSGNGGTVLIDNFADIVTRGEGSDAIRGQSIGGGGGSAGDNSGERGGNAGGKFVSMGGAGGSAGGGGAVTVTNTNSLVTLGAQADGIFVQSIGGGGGDSGRSVGLVGIGGARGGSAGNGGTVTVTNQSSGFIWTQGEGANGIFAQSIGGGGGAAGATLNVLTLPLPVEAWLKVGGDTGSGGAGGAVTIDNFGLIRTDGESSQGIMAQSIGGGGGAGSMSGSVLTLSNLPSQVGGSGTGGAGGAVSVTNGVSSVIEVNGASSTGIFAQSIGGGGGTAGIGASLVSVSFSPFSVQGPAILGGTGGAGGAGGMVTVLNKGSIVVNGSGSIGILAQSVGGGGGTARLFAIPDVTTPVGSIPPGLVFSLGGQTGASGNGGTVNVTNSGSIFLNGNNSIGIFAQSVGGGGGLVAPGGGTAGVVASAGGTGTAGTVTVENTAGSIVVTGANSTAMLLQSVGGGGGLVSGSPTPAQGAAAIGTLATDPDASATDIGGVLFMGSAGGQGASSSMTLNQTGHLIASGLNSSALVAQSHGGTGNGDITINILNASPAVQSMIIGGTGTGAGVFIMNGATNVLNNAGFIGSMAGFNGFAVRGGDGDDRVVNTGTISGSIALGAGLNSIWNRTDGLLFPGQVVSLGTGVLTNDGLFSPGGRDGVSTTSLTGSFIQSAGGTFHVDLDLQTLGADRIDISGTASFAGTLVLSLVDPIGSAMRARPGTQDYVLAAAAAGGPQSSLTLVAPQTAVAGYALSSPAAGRLMLTSIIDFAPAGMSGNASALGQAINTIQAAQQSPEFGPIAATLFYQPDVATLGATYDSLAGASAAGTQQTAIMAADRFLSVLGQQAAFWLGNQAGAPNGFTAAGDRALESTWRRMASRSAASLSAPGAWRLWVTGFDGRNELPGNAAVGSVATTSEGGGVVGGFDYQVSPRVLIGAAASRGAFDFDAPEAETRGHATGTQLAAYAAYRRPSYYAAGTVAFGFFANDVSRRAFIPGTTVPLPQGAVFSAAEESPRARFDSRAISGWTEGGYRKSLGVLEITPFVGFQFTALSEDAYTEDTSGGPSALGMSRAGRWTRSLPGFAGVQWKVQGDLGRDKVLSAWLRAAWRHEFYRERSVESEFIAAPGVPFVLRGAEPVADALRASVGVKQTLGLGLTFFAHVDGDFARSRRTFAGSVGLRAGW